jgi:hypothetical protein
MPRKPIELPRQSLRARRAEQAQIAKIVLTAAATRPVILPAKSNVPFIRGGDAMKDMREHLERLRDHAAECALLSAEAVTKEKRELFRKLNAQLTQMANHVEGVLNRTAIPDTFLGRKTYEPFPPPGGVLRPLQSAASSISGLASAEWCSNQSAKRLYSSAIRSSSLRVSGVSESFA